MEQEIIQFSGILSALFIGLLIGLKHSTDGDHIVAISTIVRDYKKIINAVWVGISWGIGHTIPLMILGTIILLLKENFLDLYMHIARYLECGVAIMVIILGLQVFWKLYKGSFHFHSHDHDGLSHTHIHGSHAHNTQAKDFHHGENHSFFMNFIPFLSTKSFFIGFVHGLAGSAAVLIAILPNTPNFFSGIIFLIFFAVGTVVAMAIMTIVLSLPFRYLKSSLIGNSLISVFGMLSIILGLSLGSDLTLGTHFTEFLWY